MPAEIELLRQGRTKELWQKCCGFIDLSKEEFMTIQRRLLLEQIERLKGCELGQKIMRGATPGTVEEFRQQVPLTTYADYIPYLPEQREEVLPEKPILWQRTSGRSGEYGFKWVPITERFSQEVATLFLAVLLFATCREREDVVLEEHDKFLYCLAPPPYASGSWARWSESAFNFDFLPPLDQAEKMSFEERIEQGFKMALYQGLDIFMGISSVLVTVGERFGQGSQGNRNGNMASLFSKPGLLLRLGKAVLKSKLARRPLRPKDLWSLKGLIAGGTDTSVYREKIKGLWGRYPLDLYGCTESIIIAMQTWDYEGMTFVPHLNLLEFIPEEEHYKLVADPSYRPRTLLLDEVKPGERYEMVVTNFHGGPFVRYRIGDMIKITSLRNETLDIDIPQMVFDTRIDGLIDLAGFTRLTEKTIWQAIEGSGLAYQDWTVRKEVGDKPILHLYLELKDGESKDEEQIAAIIDHQLQRLDGEYADLDHLLGLKPLEVTILPRGAFQEYMSKQRAAGADLAHLKPPHLNSSDAVLQTLLSSTAARH